MDLIADILLAAGALGAGFYCFVLSRRLTRFTDLENGVGGAVAVLSAQVDDLTKTLAAAQKSAAGSTAQLSALTERGEDAARQLELMLASMHDLPTAAPEPTPESAPDPESEPAAEPEPEPAREAMFMRRTTRGAA